MKIMVSACLLGRNCKYNGGNNRNAKVLEKTAGNEVIPVCPEALGGLPVPRDPSEIRGGEVVSKAGVSVDREFHRGAETVLKIAQEEKPDLIILKANSPSCGVRAVYDGTFTDTLVEGRGITAGLLIDAGFDVIEETDL